MMVSNKNSHSKEMLENAARAAQTAPYYEDVWANRNYTVGEVVLPGSFGAARVQFIQDALKRIKGMKRSRAIHILDLGCGSGWLETFISSYGTVTAIDFSSEAIKEANLKYGEHATYLLADPTSPRLGIPEDTTFDVVIASEVIEHVEHPTAFLNQISLMLKPRGWCLLTTPNANVWQKYVNDEQYWPYRQPVENWLTPHELSKLLTTEGFQVVQHEGWSSDIYPYSAISRLFTRQEVKAFLFTHGLAGVWKRLMLIGGILQLIMAQKSTKNTYDLPEGV